mgnify:CR=1 FL=1
MTGPRDLGDRPDGPISRLWYDHALRCNVAVNHAAAEGLYLSARAVSRGYDRAEHPYIHGRRPQDIARRLREVLPL